MLISYIEKPYKRAFELNMKISGYREFNNSNPKIYEWKDPDRFLAGIKLYKEGKAKKLFLLKDIVLSII